MIKLPAFLRMVTAGTDAPGAPAENLIAAGEQLAALLAQENAALADLDVPRAALLVGEKARSLAAFELACLNMHGQRIAEGGQARAIEALSARLHDLTQDNKRLLERAMFVQKRVLALFARAIARAAPTQYGTTDYGSPGGTLRRLHALTFSARA